MNLLSQASILYREGLRFTLVGMVNFTVSFVVFHLCYAEWQLGSALLQALGAIGDYVAGALNAFGIASIDASIATSVGYLAGVLNSFILNSTWTFGVEKYSHRQFRRFFVLNILGLAISSFLMFYFVDVRENSYWITWLLIMSVVTVLNFLGSKYWAFAHVE